MRRLPFIVAVILLGLVVGADDAWADPHIGSGAPRQGRLPWLAGQEIQLTQGWGGSTHRQGGNDQYATDWDIDGAPTFDIHAATEGPGNCGWVGNGWGYVAIVERINSPYYDRYAHLPYCGWTRHVMQGDFISEAGGTGSRQTQNDYAVHLHYQMENGSGWSQPFNSQGYDSNLSGFNNFCHDDSVPYCSETWYNHKFTADNAGPGVGIGIPAWGGGAMWNEYKRWGHFFCPPDNAWDCLGSSARFYGDLVKATEVTLRGKKGWHQDFTGGSAGWSGIDWPSEASCGEAYWMPSNFWIKWIQNANTLGHPRSDIYEIPTPIPYFPTGPGWYQFFRNGYIYSPVFNGANPTVYMMPSIC